MFQVNNERASAMVGVQVGIREQSLLAIYHVTSYSIFITDFAPDCDRICPGLTLHLAEIGQIG